MNKTVEHLLVAAAGFAVLPAVASAVIGSAIGWLGWSIFLLFCMVPGGATQLLATLGVGMTGIFLGWLITGRLRLISQSSETLIFAVSTGLAILFVGLAAFRISTGRMI